MILSATFRGLKLVIFPVAIARQKRRKLLPSKSRLKNYFQTSGRKPAGLKSRASPVTLAGRGPVSATQFKVPARPVFPRGGRAREHRRWGKCFVELASLNFLLGVELTQFSVGVAARCRNFLLGFLAVFCLNGVRGVDRKLFCRATWLCCLFNVGIAQFFYWSCAVGVSCWAFAVFRWSGGRRNSHWAHAANFLGRRWAHASVFCLLLRVSCWAFALVCLCGGRERMLSSRAECTLV